MAAMRERVQKVGINTLPGPRKAWIFQKVVSLRKLLVF